MRYYCKKCESVIIMGRKSPIFSSVNNGDLDCPFCLSPNGIEILPEYDTPQLYRKRTGCIYPGIRPVWYRCKESDGTWTMWTVMPFYQVAHLVGDETKQIIIADSFSFPPDDMQLIKIMKEQEEV